MIAFSYARVSSGKQKDGISIDSQHERNKIDCEVLGYKVVKRFSEIESGKDEHRPILQEMYKECQRMKGKDKVRLIAIHDWDRWFRNATQSAIWIQKFLDLGVVVNSPQKHLWVDSQDPGSLLLHLLRSGMAQAESMNISKRTLRCQYYWKCEGYYLARPPRGFIRIGKDDRNRWIIAPDPELSEKYEALYYRIAGGAQPTEVYHQLGGSKTFGAKQTFYDHLRNPIYGGKILASTTLSGYETKLVDAKFAGIVPFDVFQMALDVMDGKNKTAKTKESDELFPAKKIMRCPHCGGNVCSDMPHKKNKSGLTIYHYYRCIKTPSHYRVTKKAIDESIKMLFEDLVFDDSIKAKLLDMLDKKIIKEKAKLETEVAKSTELIEREIEISNKALRLLVDGKITREEYESLSSGKKQIENRLEKAKAGLARIELCKTIFTSFVFDLSSIFERISGDSLGRLLRIIFPSGFIIQNGKFRTERINSIFMLMPENQRLWKTIEVNQSLFDANSLLEGDKTDYFRTDIEQISLFLKLYKAA